MIELKVVPDPLAFPEYERVPIGGVPWRPWIASYTQSVQDVNDALDIMRQQLQMGMISMSEMRAKMGGL